MSLVPIPPRGRAALSILACIGVLACGGGQGGGTPNAAPAATPSTAPPLAIGSPLLTGTGSLPAPASNILPVRLDRGVRGTAFNTPFVTVTVCAPGGTTCRDIDHVMVDTASYGLRLAAGAIPPDLVLPLTRSAEGTPVGQCVHFSGGYLWGAVRNADVRLSGQAIAGLPIQVIADADPSFSTPPATCSSSGPNLGTRIDANGVLGVGMLRYDCGPACTSSTAPEIFFGCAATGCTPVTLPLRQQPVNPVAMLDVHNNGVALVLQQVPPGGAGSVEGALVLGIGTNGNNQLGAAQVMVPNGQHQLTTVYKGRPFPSFLDSGANALFFPDGELPSCGDLFCPAGPTTLQAQLQSPTGAQREITFDIESVSHLSANTVAANIAGNDGGMVTWGLPFFFGRTVFVALKDAATPAGPGPYWAF